MRRLLIGSAGVALAASLALGPAAAQATALPAHDSPAGDNCYPKTYFYVGGSGSRTQNCGYGFSLWDPGLVDAIQDASRPLERIWIHYYYDLGDILQSACIYDPNKLDIPSSWVVHDILVSENHHPCPAFRS